MIATIVYLLAVVLCGIRGVLEFEIGKSAAYLVQVGGIVLLLVWYVSPSALSAHFRRDGMWSFWSIVGLSFTIIISILITLAQTGAIGYSYLFLFAFTIFIYFYSISNYRKRFVRPGLAYAGVALIGLIQAGVGVAQQQSVFPLDLPGATYGFDNLRVPALTGSYLHYPLFVGVIASLCAVKYLTNKKLLSAVFCAVLTWCIFSSLSRSGMLIILSTFGFVFIKEPMRFLSKHAKLIIAAVVASAAVLVLGGASENSIMSTGTQRMTGATDLQSDGNDGRTEAWDKAVALARPVNVIAGSYFGLITNSAPDEIKEEYGIVESSVLQQILNIGLIGTIFYFGLLISITKLMSGESRLSACVWAALFQTLFYQSVEVIPFIFILMTLPVFDGLGKPRPT
jgi:O-Antigen ligase